MHNLPAVSHQTLVIPNVTNYGIIRKYTAGWLPACSRFSLLFCTILAFVVIVVIVVISGGFSIFFWLFVSKMCRQKTLKPEKPAPYGGGRPVWFLLLFRRTFFAMSCWPWMNNTNELIGRYQQLCDRFLSISWRTATAQRKVSRWHIFRCLTIIIAKMFVPAALPSPLRRHCFGAR